MARGGLFPLILNPDSRWSCKLHVSAVLPPPPPGRAKLPRRLLNGRVGGSQSRSGHFGEKDNPLSPPSIEKWLDGCAGRNLVANHYANPVNTHNLENILDGTPKIEVIMTLKSENKSSIFLSLKKSACKRLHGNCVSLA
jgi:hypothetical protein